VVARPQVGAVFLGVRRPVAVLVAGAWAYQHWAGRRQTHRQYRAAALRLASAKLRAGNEGAYGHALVGDYGFIAAYGIAVIAAARSVGPVADDDGSDACRLLAIGATVGAMLCDVGENETLRRSCGHMAQLQRGLPEAAQPSSVTKWALILPRGSMLPRSLSDHVVASITSAEDAARSGTGAGGSRRPSPPTDDDDKVAVKALSTLHGERIPNCRRICEFGTDQIGICVSGGHPAPRPSPSVRSSLLRCNCAVRATWCRFRWWVWCRCAQLALQPIRPTPPGSKPPVCGGAGACLQRWSSELDYTRKHGKYNRRRQR